ncbi:hypothetical protein F3Y22_tig00111708pilonHSYRG00156 [Hibiscus syriacus]|uniref:NAD-dependent epimerase/dehydratase domain-containing protein n=1 Tax=Hibiscus syriacus TaxID=106335 RepID=A0A6A2Y2W1_HIBSY|nr:hypothetical protein F3Y22_tig00111708pilonHSYRG00156 [Hibiscus syriacus]
MYATFVEVSVVHGMSLCFHYGLDQQADQIDSRTMPFISRIMINMAAICSPADYNTRPLNKIYSNFTDALPVVKYCSENNKRLILFSTCEVYGKTIGSLLPKYSPLRHEATGGAAGSYWSVEGQLGCLLCRRGGTTGVLLEAAGTVGCS